MIFNQSPAIKSRIPVKSLQGGVAKSHIPVKSLQPPERGSVSTLFGAETCIHDTGFRALLGGYSNGDSIFSGIYRPHLLRSVDGIYIGAATFIVKYLPEFADCGEGNL